MILLPFFLAVTIGLLVGVLGRLATRRRTTVPGPLVIAVSIGAALLGATGAELTGSTALGRLMLPALLAVIGVGLTTIVTQRPRAPR
ncbi:MULTISPECIES: GlsB/YeaQ/YmgE family stress response membrane protein [Catenuloplanes]|uniref:Exporter n=1 Tax=Catenuloplanes niger TaxID=587534 RepID=A0AAE3ZX90_9ACTN|nr:GlsB/YeaQ/YmgE family stress response membrane protein [Catenuloplanes niger]MDR7327526.1 putative exporter [Catenuloplanes niger]